jgi:uncharacterized membrane protein YhdT
LLALKHGLQLAWSWGYRQIPYNSDFKYVIRLLPAGHAKYHKYGVVLLVDIIRELLSRNWVVRISHTYREANACADFMAKCVARGATGLQVWFESASFLSTVPIIIIAIAIAIIIINI